MDRYMKAAIEQARIGYSEGGIPIGAVLVIGGEIVGRGTHESAGDHPCLIPI